MPLLKNDLIKLSSNATYTKGEIYFRQGRVKITENDAGNIEAEVRGSRRGHHYQVSLTFTRSGKLDYYECDCPAFEEYEGACKHIIATVLKVQEQTEYTIPQEKKSDNAAALLLNRYIQGLAIQAAQEQDGHVQLEIMLEYNALLEPALTFRVGEQRMYIVSDLNMFTQRFKAHATAPYGKGFTLWHTTASFCKESRPLVDFLLKRYDSNNHIYSRSGYYGYGGNKRLMFLSPSMADELFTLLDGKSITVRDEKKRESSARVKREDFRPSLRLRMTDGGATLDIIDWYLLLPGDEGLYVLSGGLLYCFGQAFRDACGTLLEVLKSGGRKLFFAEKDIGVLYSAVLPKVKPFVKLIAEGDFERFTPLPLITKVYLDSKDSGSVEARMTFSYGEITLDAFGERQTAVSQDIVGEILARNLLAKYFTMYEDNRLRIENDPDSVFRLISEGLDEIARVAEIYATDTFGKIKIRPPSTVSIGVRLNAGLLQLDFDLDGLDMSELPDILNSYRLAKKYHRLHDGSFLMLGDNALSGFSTLADSFDLTEKQLMSGHAELSASRALYLDTICKKNEELRVDRDQNFKRVLRDMREVENADFPVPAKLHKVLRNYQKTGFRWLKTIAAYGFGGILADDMGLGKTLQILTLLQSCREDDGETLPSIVVCPSSLSLNWESETQKFTPELRTAVIIGTAPERAAMISQSTDYDLLITSYDLLKRDISLYETLHFAFVIIDEAQYIKNQTTQNAKSVKALNSRVRFALTGTPVENSLAELWSIFDFLMPGYLFTYGRFQKKFENPIVKNGEKEMSERLKQLVRPFLLRRLKKDVLRELPPKTETILRSSMEDGQRKIYLALLAQVKQEFMEQTNQSTGQDRIMILAALTRLRQVCCDPSMLYENYTGGSAKLTACLELIESCVQSGHRMLLFSQFTTMLDIIQSHLTNQNVSYLRIDGATKPSQRLDFVNTFNQGDTPVFLISLKAGGTGLNLTGADVVIHYDPWWNVSAQNQATDRAHRIGQKNSVQVYKLIAKDTIEERILRMQERKADLANAVIESNNDPFEKLNREELLSLLEI